MTDVKSIRLVLRQGKDCKESIVGCSATKADHMWIVVLVT